VLSCWAAATRLASTVPGSHLQTLGFLQQRPDGFRRLGRQTFATCVVEKLKAGACSVPSRCFGAPCPTVCSLHRRHVGKMSECLHAPQQSAAASKCVVTGLCVSGRPSSRHSHTWEQTQRHCCWAEQQVLLPLSSAGSTPSGLTFFSRLLALTGAGLCFGKAATLLVHAGLGEWSAASIAVWSVQSWPWYVQHGRWMPHSRFQWQAPVYHDDPIVGQGLSVLSEEQQPEQS